MAQTIQAVVTAAQASIKSAISKIQSAPDYASDARIAVPTAMTYATNIVMTRQSGGFDLTWFDLSVNIMVPQGNMESAMHWLADIPQAVGDVFRGDVTITGTCQTYEGDVVGNLILDNTKNAVGYQLTVGRVKIQG